MWIGRAQCLRLQPAVVNAITSAFSGAGLDDRKMLVCAHFLERIIGLFFLQLERLIVSMSNAKDLPASLKVQQFLIALREWGTGGETRSVAEANFLMQCTKIFRTLQAATYASHEPPACPRTMQTLPGEIMHSARLMARITTPCSRQWEWQARRTRAPCRPRTTRRRPRSLTLVSSLTPS